MAEESGEGHSPLLIRWEPYLVSLFLPSPLVTLPSPFVSLSPLAVSLASIFFVSPLPLSLLLVTHLFSRNSRGSQEHRSNQYT